MVPAKELSQITRSPVSQRHCPSGGGLPGQDPLFSLQGEHARRSLADQRPHPLSPEGSEQTQLLCPSPEQQGSAAWLTAVRLSWPLDAQPTVQAWPSLHATCVKLPHEAPPRPGAACGEGRLCPQRPLRGDPREENDAKQNRRAEPEFPGYHSDLLSQVRFLLLIPRCVS